MDQVDSVNLTYDYLDECYEYTDSLESTIDGLNAVVDSGKVAEDHLKTALRMSESMDSINNSIIKELRSDNRGCRRRLKFNKFVARFSSGIVMVLGGLLLLSNV